MSQRNLSYFVHDIFGKCLLVHYLLNHDFDLAYCNTKKRGDEFIPSFIDVTQNSSNITLQSIRNVVVLYQGPLSTYRGN